MSGITTRKIFRFTSEMTRTATQTRLSHRRRREGSEAGVPGSTSALTWSGPFWFGKKGLTTLTASPSA